ncbi:MAG TPA: cyclase family protein [Terriglobales bacterium]|nr:cyclase family protein [Terriglobales bacterium]
MKLPDYDELPLRPDAPPGAAWGVFGADDELGTLNLLTPQRVREAMAEVRTGRCISLDLPLNLPDPPIVPRTPYRHTVAGMPGYGDLLDDTIDNLNTQASSQWDALAHFRHARLGLYNAVPDHQAAGRGGARLGIDRIARKVVAGRGVLLDVGRYYERHHIAFDYSKASVVPLADLKSALAEQRVELRTGDILLIRLGWLQYYLRASPEVRRAYGVKARLPGIETSVEVVRWLWNAHVAAVATDTPALEATPKYGAERERESLHAHLLVYLGMPIGELWDMEELAEACATDGRYSFFLCSVPLKLPGGVGSPPNAVAIR